MAKVKCNEQGKCPICGADIEYYSMEPDDIGIEYEWSCPKCHASGCECYNIEFAGHYAVQTEDDTIDCVADFI